MTETQAHGFLARLTTENKVLERLREVRAQMQGALTEAGFTLLLTSPVDAEPVGAWYRLRARSLVQESAQGHVLFVDVVWALDSRPVAGFGASALWVEARAQELESNSQQMSPGEARRLQRPLGQHTLSTTAAVVPKYAGEEAYARLVERLIAARLSPVQEFIDALVGDVLAP